MTPAKFAWCRPKRGDATHARRCLLRVIIQEADRLITELRSRQHDAQQRTPHIAHADNEHTRRIPKP